MSCGAHLVSELVKEYDVTLFFHNPNIFPYNEYKKRLSEVEKISKQLEYKLIVTDYDHAKWRNLVRGYETEMERGARCVVCYTDRLKKTEEVSRRLKFDYFATTLVISPHKDSKTIINIGINLMGLGGAKFINTDFKKDNGYAKAVTTARELKLYRQSYCGCEFSMR